MTGITRKKGPKSSGYQYHTFTSSQTGMMYVAMRLDRHYDVYPACADRDKSIRGRYFYSTTADITICDSWTVAEVQLLRDVPTAIEKFEKSKKLPMWSCP